MEDTDLLQQNGDDEVMVKQADGTFKKVRLSELSAPPAARKQAPPAMKPATPPVPVSLPIAKPSSPPVQASTAPMAQSAVSATADFENRADSLVGRLASDVAEDLKPRIKMLLVSFMKGIRQEYAVRERLLQSAESGGLGWTADRADLFLKQMKALSGSQEKETTAVPSAPEIKEESHQSKDTAVSVAPNLLPEIEPEMHVSKVSEAPPQPRAASEPRPAVAPRVATPKPPEPRPAPPPQPKSQSEKPTLPKSEQKKQDSSPQPHHAPHTSDGIRASAPPVLKIVEEKGEKPRVVPEEMQTPPIKQPPHVAIPQTPNGKADVKDIAYKPRLIGPIDELRTLTLVDFRRLSRDPQVAVDKIHSKVELLGEESFEKKVKGVLAWRASEVNRMYNTLLNESLKDNKPIKDVVAAHASRKEITLTMDEFHAIMNLNRQLRF